MSEASYRGCGEKELSGPKSSFQMKVNFAFHLETRSQSLEEEWRGTESMLLEVQCEVSTVSDDLGCHVICWCWSTVFSEVHSQHSHLHSRRQRSTDEGATEVTKGGDDVAQSKNK